MRLVRIIITSLAILIGLVVAAGLMLVGLVIFAIRRLLGQPVKMPVFRQPMRPASASSSASTTSRRHLGSDDVIDVVATEVKDS
jgi:hypothetical protein